MIRVSQESRGPSFPRRESGVSRRELLSIALAGAASLTAGKFFHILSMRTDPPSETTSETFALEDLPDESTIVGRQMVVRPRNQTDTIETPWSIVSHDGDLLVTAGNHSYRIANDFMWQRISTLVTAVTYMRPSNEIRFDIATNIASLFVETAEIERVVCVLARSTTRDINERVFGRYIFDDRTGYNCDTVEFRAA
jgi:hypothetical protein